MIEKERVTGDIQFKYVKFVYPSRPKIWVLRKFDLLAKSNQTTAFCGPSGSG